MTPQELDEKMDLAEARLAGFLRRLAEKLPESESYELESEAFDLEAPEEEEEAEGLPDNWREEFRRNWSGRARSHQRFRR